MQSDDWNKIDELLEAAIELEPEARRAFLKDSAVAPNLVREVESLLACEDKAKGFLAAPAMAFSSDFFDDDGVDKHVGKVIGHYRILREIGRGGMGAVFLAERADGEFKQEVALKVVRRSFADSELKRRFRRERQILATLNHPNIARLMDGGVSDDGEPYLVMEYVEGERIDAYCDEKRLSSDERLELFTEVCRGIAYAHQHLVVHRDIKPSNILISGDGVPKLLDFGIAKLLDDDKTGEHTRTEMRAYTPEYASPEQMSGAPVTTASDVFSLGVLLHKLLKNGKQSPDGGFAGAELENIVAMARHEDPERRYASAAQLAEDVQRYLDGLPVRAQKDSLPYRAGKFIRRNKIGVAAAAVIVLAVVAGTVATAWQARAAKRQALVAAQERDRARMEAAKSERINAFLQSIFAAANPSWYSSGFGQRGEVKIVDVLAQAGQRIDTDFKDQPEIRAELHHTIGTTYQSLGQFESARSHFRTAVDTYRAVYGERHPKVAEALYYLGAAADGSGNLPAARELFSQSLEMFRAVDPQNVNIPYLLSDFSGVLTMTGELEAAEQAAREGLELARQRFGDRHVLPIQLLQNLGTIYQTRGDLGQAETFFQTALSAFNRMPNGRMLSSGVLRQLGRLFILTDDLKRAENHAREALDISRQILNETHPHNLDAVLMLAEIHYRQGAYLDADKDAASLLDLLRRVEPTDRRTELAGLSLISLVHAKTKRRASANAFLKEALTLSGNTSDEIKHFDAALLGEALIEMKCETEARAVLSKGYEYFARKYGEQNPDAVRLKQQLQQLD